MKELEKGDLVYHKKFGRGITLQSELNSPFVHFEHDHCGMYIDRKQLFTKGDLVINISWNGGAHDNNIYTFYDAITHNPKCISKFTIQRKDGTIVYATSIIHFEHSKVMKYETQRSSCKHPNCSSLPKNYKTDRRKESICMNKWLRHGRDRRKSSFDKRLNRSKTQMTNYEQFKSHCEQLEQEHKALFGPTTTEATNILFDALKTGSTTFDSLKNEMFKSVKRMKRISELKDANVSRSVINIILKDEGLYDAD